MGNSCYTITFPKRYKDRRERESIMMYFGINVIRRNKFILSYII